MDLHIFLIWQTKVIFQRVFAHKKIRLIKIQLKEEVQDDAIPLCDVTKISATRYTKLIIKLNVLLSIIFCSQQ